MANASLWLGVQAFSNQPHVVFMNTFGGLLAGRGDKLDVIGSVWGMVTFVVPSGL
jgi:hypothetical protein